MRENITNPELPGRVYENVKQLLGDIRAFREKNTDLLGYQLDGSTNIMVLRIFGKQMAKYQKQDNGEYWQMEDADKKSFVSASIYKEDAYRVALNIYDYRQYLESGGKVKPELISWPILDKNNIKDFRLQLALKKIKPKTDK